jgi:glycerol dehydrogenase-like iron-containing ADH family enzyme
MTPRKERLTVTVDPDLIEAGNAAVSAGLADSLSAWVNTALAARAAQDRRLRALAAAVADYESQFGEITEQEIAAQRRADREAAVVVRGRRPGEGSRVSSNRPSKQRGQGAA